VIDLSLESARKLVENLDANILEQDTGEPHFKDPNVKPFPLEKEGFRLIKEVKSGRRLAFVDGGNQQIIGAPNFSIQLNRVHTCIWDGKEKINLSLPRIEFFSATYSTFKNDEIYFETILIPAAPEFKKYLPAARNLSFNSFERSIMNGNQRADIERVASIARRFAEWKFASIITEFLSQGDILVMDGTLQTSFKNESIYLQGLERASKKQGVILSGLSKTSALFTTTGQSLLGAVNKLSEDYNIKREWYYPIAESMSKDHNVIMLAVKLNPSAERIFRYEIQREQFKALSELQLNETLTELVKNSTDITMPGYPYGLLDVDRFARVSINELEYYRGIILSQISKIGKLGKFARHMRANDAHNIMNMLVRK
tara:strand:- start:4579 stop:5691 length:1113 start_codon:yes stop_codon:yes gene_type:complete